MLRTKRLCGWMCRAGLPVLSLGMALLFPTLGFAQAPDDARARQEKVIAELRAQIDALVRERWAAESPQVAPNAVDPARAEMTELRSRLAQLMKAHAGAEFAGYAQEVEKELAQAELKKFDAGTLPVGQVAERQRRAAEVDRAEAVARQKAAQLRDVEIQVQGITNKLRAVEAGAAQRADGEARAEQGQRFRVELTPTNAAEEIVLRKVKGKWEVVAPRAARTTEVLNQVGRGSRAENIQPRVAVIRSAPDAGIRSAVPVRSMESRIDELDRKLDKVIQQLEQLRREMKGGRTGAEAPDEGSPDRLTLPLRVIVDNEPGR